MIPVVEAVDFLSQVAPRPWVTRMLHAMLLNNELEPYFLSGRIQSTVMVAEVLSQIEGMQTSAHSDERDAAIRSQISDEVADAIRGKDWKDEFTEYDEEIEPVEGFVYAGLGFVHYGEIRWDSGDMDCPFLPDKRERAYHLFHDIEPDLGSEYQNGSFKAQFKGMHLIQEKIELLLPSHRLNRHSNESGAVQGERPRVGRPQKWDWEGAVAAIASYLVTTPHPVREHGKQAQIETLLMDWFLKAHGEAPANSQIRSRARRLLELVEKVDNSI